MKIASSNLQLAATHTASQQTTVKESLLAWVGNQRPDTNQATTNESTSNNGKAGRVLLSDAARQALKQAQDDERKARELAAKANEAKTASNNAVSSSDSVDSADAVEGEGESDPKISMIKQMVEYFTGKKVEVFDAAEMHGHHHHHEGDGEGSHGQGGGDRQTTTAAPPQREGYGVAYSYSARYSESEQMHFSASGTVKTADGKEISFKLEMQMSRSFSAEVNESLRLGDATKMDPLVINFSGKATELTDSKFQFDLDSDGDKENISFVKPGSGFLAFDRNQDGVINNGKELFGPSSNNGFAELAALDDDKNGWIDENDAAYSQLQVWSRDASGKDNLQGLKAANVGAISLKNIETSFTIKDDKNAQQGEVRSSSVFLQENGGAGTVSQIDLSV
jgi:hypothetical protein